MSEKLKPCKHRVILHRWNCAGCAAEIPAPPTKREQALEAALKESLDWSEGHAPKKRIAELRRVQRGEA